MIHVNASGATDTYIELVAVMKYLTVRTGLHAVCAAALLVAGSVHAAQQGTTPLGHRYLSGGVSDEEQSTLRAQRQHFTLWVVTAARRTGAFLADARIKVTDAERRVVYDGTLDGPWLFIDLPAGRYLVEATLAGVHQQSVTTIHPGDHHEVYFYFNVDADVLPGPQHDGKAVSR